MATDRGLLIAAGAVCAALTMALHTWIPNGAANLGSLFQTSLPWAGLSIPVFLLARGRRRPGPRDRLGLPLRRDPHRQTIRAIRAIRTIR
ncbi:hypothetical protein ABZ766_11820 [Streptomyces sp. NPDC006670]|uniref:hypothetical protein n=1 Tax=Streptomyces sp. NPDC006670 TaxID=3154476 RepID=UPI0033CABADE